jgi:hypothetical protein
MSFEVMKSYHFGFELERAIFEGLIYIGGGQCAVCIGNGLIFKKFFPFIHSFIL